MSKELIKEALDNNWSDRIFYHYQQEVDATAVRPQDETSTEWKEIVAKLTVLSTPAKSKESKTTSNDISGSTRD